MTDDNWILVDVMIMHKTQDFGRDIRAVCEGSRRR